MKSWSRGVWIGLMVWSSGLALWSRADQPEATAGAQDKPYYIGLYLYTDRFKAAAAEAQVEMFTLFDEHVGKLAAAGVNVIHVTIQDPREFASYVEVAARHGIKLLPELDFAYFRLDWTDEQMHEHAQKAIGFLEQWHDHEQVLAWSVKEEPYDADIERLDRYYRLILAGVPQARFFLVTSGGGWLTANAADLPFALVGGDYYYFSWNQGPADDAYALWPAFALSESRATTQLYRRAAAKFNVDRIHVFGVAACTIPTRAQGFVDGSLLPESWAASDRQAYQAKVRGLAQAGRAGWSVYDDIPGATGPRYSLWTLYMPPPNGTRALIWSGIMEGAKVTLGFSYDPYSRAYNPDSPRDAIVNYPHRTECFYTDLAGRPDQENPRFEEFARTVGQVRRFDRILPRLDILEDSPLVSSDEGVEFFSQLPAASVTPHAPPPGFLGHQAYSRAFRMPGFAGQVLIVHNADVGRMRCPDCRAARIESCRHVWIDDRGELMHFEPWTQPRRVRLKLKPEYRRDAIHDVVTGRPLERDAGASVIAIEPGGAAVVYLGTASEARRLAAMIR